MNAGKENRDMLVKQIKLMEKKLDRAHKSSMKPWLKIKL